MEKLFISIIIGVIAGGIDVIPMYLQKLDKYSMTSAFVQWVIAGFVITHIELGMEGWLKGGITGVLLALPIIILVMKTDGKSVIPIMVMSLLLGSIVGFAADKLT